MNELTITTELKELTPEKSAQIKAVFDPMVEMLESFEDAYNKVIAMEPGEETSKIAKRLRLDIGKIRIQADKKHKELKAEALRTGRAIDGIRNILKFAVTDKEEKLKEIETHFERIEAERIAIIGKQREVELSEYDVEFYPSEIATMAEEVWNNYKSGVKLNYEAVKEAERKAEADRLAAEEAERAENERIRKENERLQKEAEERERKIQAENRRKEKALEKERAEVAAREEKARLEAEEIQRQKDEEIRKEREAREKLEAEAEAFRLEEIEMIRAEEARKAQIEAERKRAEIKAANAPDKEKLQTISDNILSKLDIFTSEEAKTAMRDAAQVLFEAANRL